ncbi:hypothetical protein SNE40_002994 [Patella caerulea]|uniref:Uncharacterized protein n=1 Tax=Patella caerulea TaxID=87958 RepID=A0AAN8KH26_PATCE
MNTLKRGKGEIILERRPRGKFELKEYGPCPGCYLWLNHKLLRKHKNVCVAKCDFSKSASLITQSKIISGRIHTSPSQTLLNEVFSSMNMDMIGTVAREDPLIVELGNQWIQKNVGNRLKRGAYTGQIMRLCARLLINLREITPITEEPIFWNYLKASFFDDIVEATLKTANAISEDNLEKPSNACKLGFDIKKLINGKIGISIMTNDEPSRKEAEDLLKTMEIFGGTRVAKLSNVILEQRKYEKHKQLPNPDDIEELNKSLECSLKGLDLTTTTLENFTNVVEMVEAKLVIYNRRRVGELEAIRLADYENRKKGEAPHHLVGQLSEFERKILTEQEVMTVRGKTGRGVPVILPAITKAPLSYLTDSSVRSACGISSKNVYVFAGKGEGVIRAYNSVLKACSRAPLKSPQLITSTNLRKYMATVTQVFDLKPNEMNWVLDHLGHSMDVHKIHYRASSEILEKTQIAKLLLLQDSNQIGKYKNMSLKDIQIEDLVMDDQVQSPVTEDFDKQVFEESQMDSDCEEIKDKRKPAVSIKVKWTPEEDEEIKQLFKKCILKKKRLSPKDCQKALERSKLNGGVLWKRKKDVLKKKMFRLIDKLNKN